MFGVCHATGQLWKLCGFLLLVEVKHQMLLITELLKAVQIQRNLLSSIIHQPAHSSRRTKEETRNSLTGTAAKATAWQPYEPLGFQTAQRSGLVVPAPAKMCLAVQAEEIDSRKRYEVTKESQGMWEADMSYLSYRSNTPFP